MRLAGDDCGRCHFGIKCRNTRCDYAHPSPALECGARRPQTPPRSPGPRRIEAQAGRIGLRDVEAQIREQVELARALALSMADGGNGRGRGRGGGVGDEAAPRTVGEYDDDEEYACLICRDLMHAKVDCDPVLAEDGRVYCRACIEKWFRVKSTSPLANLPIGRRLEPRPRPPRGAHRRRADRHRRPRGPSALGALEWMYGITINYCDSSLPGFDDHDAYDDCYDYWEACVGGPSARSGCESRVLLRAIERRERQSERQHVCVHICVHICAHAV